MRLDVIAKMPLKSLAVRAYLDKIPVSVPPPEPLMPLARGDRRSVDLLLNIPGGKEHWLYVEVESVLPTGEHVTAGKSLQINPARKGQRPETYETYRTGRPQK